MDPTPSAKAAPPELPSAGGLPGHYVYVLRSLAMPARTYTGRTAAPVMRLADHNAGNCPHTAKFRPWRIETLIAFTDPGAAIRFERHLKTGSGRAFAKRHFG